MERPHIRIDEIIEGTGEGQNRTIKTPNGHYLVSEVEIIYTEPDPIPYASPDEMRTITPRRVNTAMQGLYA